MLANAPAARGGERRVGRDGGASALRGRWPCACGACCCSGAPPVRTSSLHLIIAVATQGSYTDNLSALALRAVPAPGAAARRRATQSWTRASPPPRGRNRAHASTTRSVGSAYFELYRKSIEIPIELVL